MGTFSKSLASCGGFLAGSHEVIDFLRVQARAFLFTASAVPAAVGAALAALRIIRSDEGPELFARVLDNARYLRDGLRDLGFAGRRRRECRGRPGGRRRRLEGRAAVARALRRRRLRQRRPAPRGAARRGAAAHERDGHPRPRDARPRARRSSLTSRRRSRPSTAHCQAHTTRVDSGFLHASRRDFSRADTPAEKPCS